MQIATQIFIAVQYTKLVHQRDFEARRGVSKEYHDAVDIMFARLAMLPQCPAAFAAGSLTLAFEAMKRYRQQADAIVSKDWKVKNEYWYEQSQVFECVDHWPELYREPYVAASPAEMKQNGMRDEQIAMAWGMVKDGWNEKVPDLQKVQAAIKTPNWDGIHPKETDRRVKRAAIEDWLTVDAGHIRSAMSQNILELKQLLGLINLNAAKVVDVKEAYAQGWTVKQIADRFRMDEDVVAFQLERYKNPGLEFEKKINPPAPEQEEDFGTEITPFDWMNATDEEIKERSNATLRNVLMDQGIVTNPRQKKADLVAMVIEQRNLFRAGV